jgi:hypothetical protein
MSIKSQEDPCKVCTGPTLSQVLKDSQGGRAQGVHKLSEHNAKATNVILCGLS